MVDYIFAPAYDTDDEQEKKRIHGPPRGVVERLAGAGMKIDLYNASDCSFNISCLSRGHTFGPMSYADTLDIQCCRRCYQIEAQRRREQQERARLRAEAAMKKRAEEEAARKQRQREEEEEKRRQEQERKEEEERKRRSRREQKRAPSPPPHPPPPPRPFVVPMWFTQQLPVLAVEALAALDPAMGDSQTFYHAVCIRPAGGRVDLTTLRVNYKIISKMVHPDKHPTRVALATLAFQVLDKAFKSLKDITT